jgi:hypothetical protein
LNKVLPKIGRAFLMKNSLFVLLLFFVTLKIESCYAQVSNDNIENRIELFLNKTHSSKTANCTVQWECVDETLTGKEVEYHNDQWFDFNTESSNKYFINVSNQRCRDRRGVQLVVIDGQPCQPETYEIVSCVSLATQDDIFVELKNLKLNHSYLVNIDGYLHDYCSFDLTLSDKANGLPLDVDPISKASFTSDPEAVTIHWQIPEENDNAFNKYQIFRKGQLEKTHQLIDELEHEQDTYGHFKRDYFYTDTLNRSGIYHYKIVAISPEQDILLVGELNAHYEKSNSQRHNIKLILTSKEKTRFEVLIYDKKSEKLLMSEFVELNDNLKANNYFKVVYYNMREFKEFGFHNFKVVTINHNTKVKKEEFF